MSARQMGMHAARSIVTHMAGEESELDNGQKLDKQYEVLLRVTLRLEYVKTVMKDRKMQGALLMGETYLEETFGNLILN